MFTRSLFRSTIYPSFPSIPSVPSLSFCPLYLLYPLYPLHLLCHFRTHFLSVFSVLSVSSVFSIPSYLYYCLYPLYPFYPLSLPSHLSLLSKCRHLKKLTCKGIFRQAFIRVYRLERQSVMLVFSTRLCKLLPLQAFSLVHLPPPPSLCQSTLYTDSVWLGRGLGVLSCVGDHILQSRSLSLCI